MKAVLQDKYGGADVLMNPGLDRIHYDADFFEQAFHVRDLEDHPDRSRQRPGMRDDLVAGGGDVVAARGGHVSEKRDDWLLLLLADPQDLTS